MRLITGAIALLALLELPAAAETAYVTDALQLGLHQAADTSDAPFRHLDSAQQVEILSQTQNAVYVQLPDGTRGYVKTGFLVTDPPTQLRISESAAEQDRYAEELEAAGVALAASAATNDTLREENADLQARLDGAATQAEQLVDENARLLRREVQTKNSMPLQWVAGAVAACLAAGFLLGLWWADHRSRKRHGGIRIY